MKTENMSKRQQTYQRADKFTLSELSNKPQLGFHMLGFFLQVSKRFTLMM